jgi:hypothetical protein
MPSKLKPSKLHSECAGIEKDIKDHQAELKTAPTSLKAGIARQIKQLRVDLAACKKKHPK